MDDLLKEMAAKRNGMVMLRDPMGAAGERHRERRRNAEKLVRVGYARWANDQQTFLRITEEGRGYLIDNAN